MMRWACCNRCRGTPAGQASLSSANDGVWCKVKLVATLQAGKLGIHAQNCISTTMGQDFNAITFKHLSGWLLVTGGFAAISLGLRRNSVSPMDYHSQNDTGLAARLYVRRHMERVEKLSRLLLY